MPMTDAIVAIDDEFTASIQVEIDNAKASNTADVVEILFTGDMEDENSSVSNWVDVWRLLRLCNDRRKRCRSHHGHA